MSQKQPIYKTVTFKTFIFLIAILILAAVLAACLPSQQVEVTGRVLDDSTAAPLQGAKVTLDIQGRPGVVYTDATGSYGFVVYSMVDRVAGRVSVEVDGYEPFDRNITLSLNSPNFEEIRLAPLAVLSSPGADETAVAPTEEAVASALDSSEVISPTGSLSPTATLSPTLEMTQTLEVEAEPTRTATVVPTPTLALTGTTTPEPTRTPTRTPTSTPTPEPRLPFEGTFEGTILGDAGSQAPLTLILTQEGNQVIGTATLGDGLSINVGGGLCGGVQTVPASVLDVNAQINPTLPRHIESVSELEVSGFSIGVEVLADLSEDDETLTVQIALKPPFFCLQPRLMATL
jgi:archaellum component FlaG (FlaF/FlaG flagellin family)